MSIYWFEVNNIDCVVSPDGGSVGYLSDGCNSVEEVVLTGNKLQAGKKHCGEHPQKGKWRENSSS